MLKITDYELISHGFEASDYFGGCGTAFTSYDNVVTGCADTEEDAFKDALGQIHQQHSDVDTSDIFAEADDLDYHPPHTYGMDSPHIHYYFSIRYNLPEAKENV
jgi:hypothetical protein